MGKRKDDGYGCVVCGRKLTSGHVCPKAAEDRFNRPHRRAMMADLPRAPRPRLPDGYGSLLTVEAIVGRS